MPGPDRLAILPSNCACAQYASIDRGRHDQNLTNPDRADQPVASRSVRRPASPVHAASVISTADMQSLRAELRAAGVFAHDERAGWLKFGAALAVVAACLVGIVLLPLAAAFVLVPIAAIFATTGAMFGHEGSHRSFASSPFRNQLLQHIAFPLFTGLGASYWKYKHDGKHHGHPNVYDQDPDLHLWPMVSSRLDHERATRPLRWFHRHLQGWAFWPLTTLMPIGMRGSSIIHLVREARRGRVDGSWIADASCLATHYTAWLVIPSLVWGVAPTFALYFALWSSVGVLLALVFAPAHIGLPVAANQYNDWQHQLETTRNLATPRWLSWFFVGLDFQIEHHLFPKIPHQHIRRAAVIVSAWCRRLDLPYRTIGYGPAVVSVTRFMHGAWNEAPVDRDAMRAASAPRRVATIADAALEARTSGESSSVSAALG